MVAKREKRFRFTAERLDGLPCPAQGAAVYYDADVKHLGVRVQPTGRKSFFVMKQVQGRPQRKTLGPVGELKLDAARKHANRLLTALADWKAAGCTGLSPAVKPEKGVSFAEAFEFYVAYMEENIRKDKNPARAERAAKRVRWINGKYLSGDKKNDQQERPRRKLFSLQKLTLAAIGDTTLKDLHITISENHGPYSANRALEVVSGVFRYSMKKRLAESDPSRDVTMFKEKKRDTFLQPDELVRFRKAVDAEANVDVRDFVLLLLATGVRKSNLYAAQLDEFSEALGTWTIPETKPGDALTVQLTPAALAIFKARKKRISSPWVFPSTESKSGHVTDYKKQWNRLRKAAGVPNVRMHDLRRTNASYQTIAGGSLPIVGASLGHKSTSSTEIYARLHQSAVRKSLLDGEAMQKELMAAAQKQLKDAARKQRRLPAATTAQRVNRG